MNKVNQVLEEVCEAMCENYCKFRDLDQEELNKKCEECPLNKLQ